MQISGLWGVLMMVLGIVTGVSAGGADSASSQDSLIGRSWVLVSLEGGEPASGPPITLRFEAAGTLGGFDGCNSYQGSYARDGAKLAIDKAMAVTLMACPEPAESLARAYGKALARTVSFAVEGARLSLQDAAQVEVAGFEAQSLVLSGTSWEVLSYNNGKEAVVSLIRGTRITASFGDDGRVTGSAGCNRYFASYESQDEAITVGLAGSTRKYCAVPEGVMEQESLYLEALHSAAKIGLAGNKLTLRRADGATAVTLVRASGEASRPAGERVSKIRFNLDKLDSQGLQGPPDGLRSLHYEYCIPDQPEAIREVAAIDPTLEIQRSSPGRIGCGAGELLCLGHSHQPEYRSVLRRLAGLAFIAEIRESFFE